MGHKVIIPPMARFRRCNQSGFNLIEICLSMLLLGILIGTALQIYKQHLDQRAYQITEKNMRVITKALSNYAMTNNRLPCPSRPDANGSTFGFESGTPAATIANGRPSGDCSDGNLIGGVRNGLVPYQTLNIPYENVIDGWGRYFTYGVSPVFTQPNDIFRDANGDGDDDGDIQRVHQKCREAGWVNAEEDPVNGPKARFCCAFSPTQDQTTDIVVRNRDNAQVVSPVRAGNGNIVYADRMDEVYRTGVGGQVLVSLPSQASGNDVEAAAFTLISHGNNGYCAFLGNNTMGRSDCTGPPASTDEISNGNGNTYITGTRTNDFDDVVVWMTQFGIMAAGGANSCNLP